jgi:hypothetical protein
MSAKKSTTAEKVTAFAAFGNFLLKTFRTFRHLAVVSFLGRYWLLLLILAILAALLITNVLWTVTGAMLWVPALTFGAMATALLLRNIFNKSTSDEDADSGRFDQEWDKLDAKTRVVLTVIQILVYFLGAAIIAAAVAK